MPAHVDRQMAIRSYTEMRGRISFGSEQLGRVCIVRNISETGAKLEVGSVQNIPDAFDLLLPGALPCPCEVVWRRNTELGVSFQASTRTKGDTDWPVAG